MIIQLIHRQSDIILRNLFTHFTMTEYMQNKTHYALCLVNNDVWGRDMGHQQNITSAPRGL